MGICAYWRGVDAGALCKGLAKTLDLRIADDVLAAIALMGRRLDGRLDLAQPFPECLLTDAEVARGHV